MADGSRGAGRRDRNARLHEGGAAALAVVFTLTPVFAVWIVPADTERQRLAGRGDADPTIPISGFERRH